MVDEPCVRCTGIPYGDARTCEVSSPICARIGELGVTVSTTAGAAEEPTSADNGGAIVTTCTSAPRTKATMRSSGESLTSRIGPPARPGEKDRVSMRIVGSALGSSCQSRVARAGRRAHRSERAKALGSAKMICGASTHAAAKRGGTGGCAPAQLGQSRAARPLTWMYTEPFAWSRTVGDWTWPQQKVRMPGLHARGRSRRICSSNSRLSGPEKE